MGKTDKTKINIKERVDDTTIDLSLSDISEIPVSGIANFKRATILDLSSNKITTLGKNFCTLTHLTKLDLSKNQLKFLPDDLSKLINLRHLDLYDNKLEHLPLAFGKLKNLRYLDLKRNPLTPALAKIVGPCATTKDCQNAARTIVKFFDEMQQTIDEDRERTRKEELERQEAEAEAEAEAEIEKEQIETVKAKPKGKTKKEKKKETKLNDENVTSTNNYDSNLLPEPSVKRKSTIWRILFYSLLLWFMFAFTVVFAIFRMPHLIENLITRLPGPYQGTLLYHFEKIREEIGKYLKSKH